MYKVKNPYKECHIMDLNMMDISRYKQTKFSIYELLLCISPLVAIGAYLIQSTMPEFGFLAECQNIPGGDICSISIK